ncbi:AlbA family DNA-binding domain-containing protein [Cellulomonas hominis]
MADDQRLSRYQRASDEAARLLALGESGRCEFKRDADVVTVGLLAALANWVALDGGRDVAHLLIGVEEVQDADTGLTYGRPFGLPKGLDKAVSRIQDLATRTRPVPVDAFVVEEAVGEDVPFIRVEVRPTFPPHFDDEGRRQTRQGRSTRALTDDELLSVYLSREAGSFAARFRQAGDELSDAVGAVGSQVDQIASAIENQIARPLADLQESAEYAASAAGGAEDAAHSVASDVTNVEDMVRRLQRVVETLRDETTEALAARVQHRRQQVWLDFSVDTWERTSARATRLADRLRNLLSTDISLDAARNTWEIGLWDDYLHERTRHRGGTATLKWWSETVSEAESFFANPVYGMADLPDIRSELQNDLDAALDDPGSTTRTFAASLDELGDS